MTNNPQAPAAAPKAPATKYSVTADKPVDVRDDLCRIWSENLTLEGTPNDKFRWLYEDAPYLPERVFVLRARDAATGDEKAVGTNAINVRRFQIAPNRESLVGVCSDLAVDRAHRSLLPALSLVKSSTTYSAEHFDMTYGFPNKKARSVVVRAGFKVLGEMHRHVRVLRHASYAKRLKERANIPPAVVWAIEKGDGTVAMEAAGAAIDVARLAMRPKEVARAFSSYRLRWEPPGSFDERFDTLWKSARSEYDIVGERTSTFLKWRYPKCGIATLHNRKGNENEILAYCLVDYDAQMHASILDVFGHQEFFEPLIDRMLVGLWRTGAVNVSVSYLGAPKLAAIFKKCGFVDRDDARTIVVLAGKNEKNAERFEDASRWHLLPIDEDT
jgi:hypothetical protein